MATTRESIADGFRWCLGLLAVFVRRAIIFGVFAGIFAAAVIFTTRDRVPDCGDLTDPQQTALESLRESRPDRSFVATGPAVCDRGVHAAPLDGLAATMESATRQLIEDGWELETEFVPFFENLWRRCFSRAEPGWEQVQIEVDALRSGIVRIVRATALENVDACDLERREGSPYYPPSR